jgi:formylglycine-generating enzyme required for sulfatase activity
LSRLIEIRDTSGTIQYTGDDLPLTIGSTTGAHIQLQDGKGVEGYIGVSQGYLFIQPAADSSPTYHNDQHIKASTWIKSGDSTRIGPFLLHYKISGDLLEIHVSRGDDQEMLIPPGMPHPETNSVKGLLPRISGKDHRAGGSRARRFSLLAGGVFLLLLLAATFVLTARSLEIEVSPEPETLSVSGFPPVFKFGRRFLGLSGNYSVQAAKAGYKDLEAPVTISRNETNRFAFSLEKLPGRVDFFTTPVEGAQVIIDGRSAGTTPLNEMRLAAGEHRIRIVKERYLEQEQTVAIEGLDRKQRFDFTLAPAWSEVTLNTEPTGATVSIGSQEYGNTPLSLELLAGSHTVIFAKQDYLTHTMELEVEAGAQIFSDTIALQLAPAIIELKSKPSGATVAVSSVYRGRTPLQVELSAKKRHALELSLPGYENLREKITLGPGESKTLAFNLQPQYGIIFLTVHPPEAELYIDGELHSEATDRLQLTVKEHTLEVRARGYKSETRTVTPHKSYSRQIDIRLLPEEQFSGEALQPERKITIKGHQLILLKPAAFQMGASKGEQGRRANERQHKVIITRPFYLSSKEVTNAEFRLFESSHRSGRVSGNTLDKGQQPVANVTWEEAVRYLNWLSQQDGLAPFYKEENGKMVPARPFTTGYRLPLEAEWAYAARLAGRQEPARYAWAGTFPPRGKSGNYADESAESILPVIIKGYNDTFAVSAPVGSFPVNKAGFFDLDGNVSEWCHDFYTPYTDIASDVKTDPMGPVTGTHHVVRGASWRDGSITELRLSYRGYSREKRDDMGFRIARYAQ